LGAQPPGEKRQTMDPVQRRQRQSRVRERVVDEEEQYRGHDRRGDRHSCPLLARHGAPSRTHLVAEADRFDLRLGHYPPSGVFSPSKPSGRKTRIRMRIEKTIVSVQSEPGECQLSPSLNAWISPISTAPRTAPGRLPMPPSTAAVNAISPSWKPWSNLTVCT